MGDSTVLDVVIVGAGPAGVSCAIWLARLGFQPVLLEGSDRIGGLCCDHPFSDGWNATLPEMTGPEVARNLARSLELAHVDTRLSCPVIKIERVSANGTPVGKVVSRHAGIDDPDEHLTVGGQAHDASIWNVHVDRKSPPLRTRHVVLATGVSPRTLPGWPADKPLPPGVVAGPGTAVVQQDFAGARVAVLGGGDNAFENALYARQHGAAHVNIFARTVRAQQQFVQQFPAHDVVHGSYEVDAQRRTVNGQSFDLILVFYGWEARLPDMSGQPLQRCANGFVVTHPKTAETSLPGVYAIGEVALRMHPCVVTAMADGVTAAKAIQARLEMVATPA